MEKLADNRLEYNDKVYISNSACMEDAKAVANLIEREISEYKREN